MSEPCEPKCIVPRRLAVFVPNWVGDAVMATLTPRALRKRCGPDAKAIGIMKPPIAEIPRGIMLVKLSAFGGGV